MNRKRAFYLLAIFNALIYIPLAAFMGIGKVNILAGIIIFAAVAIITMALAAFIINKYPPMDEG